MNVLFLTVPNFLVMLKLFKIKSELTLRAKSRRKGLDIRNKHAIYELVPKIL